MNYSEANYIVHKFVDAVALGVPKGCTALRESVLPCSKDKIVDAYKVFMAHVVKHKTLSKEDFDRYLMLLKCLGAFVDDKEASMIDNFFRLSDSERIKIANNEPEKYNYCFGYNLRRVRNARHDEVCQFVDDLQELDVDDPLWCEKVYNLANIEYKPEYKRYFDDPNYVEPQINVEKTSKSRPNMIDGPTGIGGWLILVVLQIFLTSSNLITGLSENFKAFTNSKLLSTLMTNNHPYYSPYWGFVITLQTIFGTFIGIYIIITAIFFFKASKKAIKLMIIYYILICSYAALIIISNSLIPYSANNESANSLGSLIGTILASLIWISYFLKSKRVRNTFVL